MKRSACALVSWLFTLSGCTVTAVSASDGARFDNSCTSSTDCEGGASCRNGICQTRSGELSSLLITATPPSDSSLPHLTFVTQLADLSPSGDDGGISIPGPTQVSGSLSLPKGQTCYPSFISDDPSRSFATANDGTVPVTVTFALHQRLLGLSQNIYYAKSKLTDLVGYAFDLLLPGGQYDVYLQPPKHQDGSCVVPPQLFRAFAIGVTENDESNATVKFRLSALSNLNLRLKWPVESPALTGWAVDIIEPLAGNPISTEVVLGEPKAAGNDARTVQYAIPLVYSTVVDAAPSDEAQVAGDLVRLRPPAGLIAPTIFLDRSALGLLQTRSGDAVELTSFTRYPSKVEVHGQLVRRQGGSSTPGFVSFVSTEIYGVDAGVFASYESTVEAKADGLINVSLPPGKYRVYGVPPQPISPSSGVTPLAAAETSWEIPADVAIQFGKVLELSGPGEINGQSRLAGAQVQAVPTPRRALPFEQAFGAAPFSPRAAAGLVDAAGHFNVQVDSGRFDVTLQPPEGLGFPWFVRPGVQVGSESQDIGRILPPAPSVLSGTASLRFPEGPRNLTSAAIRAYAYLDKDLAYTSDPLRAVSIVQVAETRSDPRGSFRLLLPSTLPAPN